MIPAKKYTDNIHLLKDQYRIGKERRLNWTKHVLEEGTPMPKPITYKDIDEEFIKWVETELSITYQDKEVPTLKSFSNQRISEYIQAWKYQDKDGNLQMNLKTIRRENNPKWGTLYDRHNIPAHRTYAVYYLPVLGENGQVTYDRYSITQPIMIDMKYSVQLITNKMELLNDFNLLINSKFAGITCNIYPKGYSMPMTLSDISDNSEYSIDNRKYYSQQYDIELKAYIIREQDIEITKMPTRWKPSIDVLDNKHKRKTTDDTEVEFDYKDNCEEQTEEARYTYRNVFIYAKTGLCNKPIIFTYQNDSEDKSEFVLRDIELDNTEDIKIFINNEIVDFNEDKDIKFYDDDEIRIEYKRKDVLKEGKVNLIGFDSLAVVDEQKELDAETVLDIDKNEADRIIELD